MAESKEELKSFLMKVKEESGKAGLKLSSKKKQNKTKQNKKKNKIMATIPTTSWQIVGGKVEIVTDFVFLGSKITADIDRILGIKRPLLLEIKTMTNQTAL